MAQYKHHCCSLMVILEVVTQTSVMSLARIPNLIGVHRVIRVLFDGEVSISCHEVPVKSRAFKTSFILVPVLTLEHRLLCEVFRWLFNHCSERFQVRPVVPLVAVHRLWISDISSEKMSKNQAWNNRVVAEGEAWGFARLRFREVVDPSVHGDTRNTKLHYFKTTTNHCSNGPCKERAE